MKSIPAIYEDEHVLVLNKPAGILVHSDGRSAGGETLSDKILKEYPELKEVGEQMTINGKTIYRPGIVHRLDKDTSGVIVVAKDQETFLFLKKQFQGREIEKVYRAIVYGRVKEDKGVIDKPIGRSPADFRQWSAHATARGKIREAVTEYKVLERFNYGQDYFTYLELYPKTGRTHQIRVHLKFINHPVLCDPLYAGKRGDALGMNRLALHAFKISFSLPGGPSATNGTARAGKKISCEAEIPEDMAGALRRAEAAAGNK
ncbi:MAG: RluA family pseudouridine synthase [Patescibacteria group bacterium]